MIYAESLSLSSKLWALCNMFEISFKLDNSGSGNDKSGGFLDAKSSLSGSSNLLLLEFIFFLCEL